MILDVDQLQNLALKQIEMILQANGMSLKNFGSMPLPTNTDLFEGSTNRLMQDKLSYSKSTMTAEHNRLCTSLTAEQKQVYNTILSSVAANSGGVYFLYGYGGTGKTFVWKTLSAALRSKRKIVLNVASSGIASLLLNDGRTTHSRFSIPININEDSVCHILPDSWLAELVKETSLIIWDEAPMIHRHSFESLDRTFRDILKTEMPFGGKVIVFGGDFRQILPVVPCGSRSEIVNASLKSSYIWDFTTVLRLTFNMRLQQGSNTRQQQEIKEFAEWLLKVGDGKLSEPNDGEVEIEIPDDLLIKSTHDPLSDIIECIYPEYVARLYEPKYFEDRAILAPTHETVNLINDTMLATLTGEQREYLSSDSISQSDLNPNMSPDLYSTDFLNKIKMSGLPNHKLTLKVGTPVMLLRNIDQQQGLCNGTLLQVKRLCEHVIEAAVISGSHVGHITYIPRMKMTSSDKKMLFQFQRRQFPLSICFAMTINKSQGQSLENVGLYLPKPVFTHGQLYVAMSRVKSRKGMKILICDEDGHPTNHTINVVYKEVLQNL
uniref:ATP-dependent DNA helicase pif1-like n=1 Tax=Erigeron canadensis TaxID=72917 RepID=UPI001CB95CF2|nr:ATP-dependent DNA helicase pif1-like [Erigeron canadensis]